MKTEENYNAAVTEQDQLAELRRQMATMKAALEQSRIMNREMMGRVIKSKVSGLNIFVMTEPVIVLVAFVVFLAQSHAMDVTPWLAWTFLIMGAIDTLLDMKSIYIPPKDFSTLDMRSMRCRLLRQRKMRKIQIAISTPAAVIWGLWYLWIMYGRIMMDNLDESVSMPWLTPAIICIVVGVVMTLVVLVIYRKIERINDTILASLGEDPEPLSADS
ncbi:MAG: hypothetical protein K2N19_01555 [Muribaculaceae bacterium]|nr:hypothetical protein [Muribaculaceae bacterium]